MDAGESNARTSARSRLSFIGIDLDVGIGVDLVVDLSDIDVDLTVDLQ